jgi:hypothetical protein
LLAGQTNSWLVLSNTLPSNTGAYRVVVSNNFGTVSSPAATLTVSVPAVTLTPIGMDTNGFQFSFNSLAGVLYIVEYTNRLEAGTWMELERRFGVGGLETVTDNSASDEVRFYRVRGMYAPSPRLGSVSPSGGAVTFSFPTAAGAVYVVQYKDRLGDPDWLELSRQTGTGAPQVVNDPNPPAVSRFYRVKVE